MTWRAYLISFTVLYCFLFRFVCIELVSLIWFLQIWVAIYVYGTMINKIYWSTLIKKLMQTYIVTVSGSILNVSTVHLNGIWHLIWRYLSKPVLGEHPVLGGHYSIPRGCPLNTGFTVLLLSLLATVKNVKLQCKVLGNYTYRAVRNLLLLLFFVIYEVQPDSVPRCLTFYSSRGCFGLIQNKQLRCISNHSELSSAIIEFAFPGHKFAPRRKIFSVLQTTIVRSELPGRSSMYGFFHTTPKIT